MLIVLTHSSSPAQQHHVNLRPEPEPGPGSKPVSRTEIRTIIRARNRTWNQNQNQDQDQNWSQNRNQNPETESEPEPEPEPSRAPYAQHCPLVANYPAFLAGRRNPPADVSFNTLEYISRYLIYLFIYFNF